MPEGIAVVRTWSAFAYMQWVQSGWWMPGFIE
jgi:hypothetical protein